MNAISPLPWSRNGRIFHDAHGTMIVQCMTARDAGRVECGDGNADLLFAAPQMRAALTIAERFMAGFEGDELQDGIDGMLATVRGALALAGGAAAVAQTPAPAFPKLSTISADYDDARQALADAEDDAADDVAKAGMDEAAGAGFDLARAALDALATMRAEYGVLHDRMSPLAEGNLSWSEAVRAGLADTLARCCDADAHAARVLAGQDATAAPQTPALAGEALRIVLDLARGNVIDEHDDAAEHARQVAAISAVEAVEPAPQTPATQDDADASPTPPTTDALGVYIRDMLGEGYIDAPAAMPLPGCIPEDETRDSIESVDAAAPSNLRLHMASGAVFVVRIIREG